MNISSIQPTLNFTSKSHAVKKALKRFDKDMLTQRNLRTSVETQRLVLQKLMQGFDVDFLVKMFDISKHRVYQLSTKYDARRIYIQKKKDIILKRLLAGQKRERIAKEMNIDITSVHSVAENNNTYSLCKTNRDNLIKEKYLAGMKFVDIAKELNIDPDTVARAIKRMGVKKA